MKIPFLEIAEFNALYMCVSILPTGNINQCLVDIWKVAVCYWKCIYHQLRARRAVSIVKDVPVRTRRALSLYSPRADCILNMHALLTKMRINNQFSTDSLSN